MKKIKLLITLLSLGLMSFACTKDNDNNKSETTIKPNNNQPVETDVTLVSEGLTIYGSLKMPNSNGQVPVVLIIAGSGPTDRNGNNTISLNTNTYKMLSDTLAMHGIASVRYDKRGVSKSIYSGMNEANLTFENYVTDAKNWIDQLKKDKRFSKIIILGHSEGALIGSIVANQYSINQFISVSGTAQRADSILLEQLSKQPENIVNESHAIVDSLNKGILVSNVSLELYSIFRPSVQPYLISWFKYSPLVEVSKIKIPILIIHGNTDIQIKSIEATKLGASNPNSTTIIIDNMNHILKNSSIVYIENTASYSNPNLPLSPKFCSEIIKFINN